MHATTAAVCHVAVGQCPDALHNCASMPCYCIAVPLCTPQLRPACNVAVGQCPDARHSCRHMACCCRAIFIENVYCLLHELSMLFFLFLSNTSSIVLISRELAQLVTLCRWTFLYQRPNWEHSVRSATRCHCQPMSAVVHWHIFKTPTAAHKQRSLDLYDYLNLIVWKTIGAWMTLHLVIAFGFCDSCLISPITCIS